MTLLALWIPLICVALAGRVERVTELAEAGSHAEVVETVTKWEGQGALGDDAEALVLLRDRSALNLALATHTTKALATFRSTYPMSALLPEALKAEEDLAFDDAQDEGSAAALRTFLGTYPTSEWRARALTLEDGLAFQEAIAAATPEAMDEFRRYHPSSPYLATAWEAIAAHTPGIHLLLSDRTPYMLPATAIVDEHIALERSPAAAPVRPTVAVNLPGTGRGATSEWWGLHAVGSDGSFLQTSPLGMAFLDAFGAVPPGLLDLAAAPGAHSARVADTVEPLVAPGSCEGLAHFAFVLRTSDGTRTAFPFAVSCTLGEADTTTLSAFAGPMLLQAVRAAEHSNGAAAVEMWRKALTLPGGGRLGEWLAALAHDADPLDLWITRRAATGDVLAFTPSPSGGTTTWWHLSPEGVPLELAHRDGLWIAEGHHLWTVQGHVEPWTAPAEKGCKAASGERTALALTDALGSEAVPIPFSGSRGGVLTVVGYAAGVLTVADDGSSPGCARAGVAQTRALPLPGATPVTAPAWAVEQAGTAFSVIGDNPRDAWAAFSLWSP